MTCLTVRAARLAVVAVGLLFALCTSASAQGGRVTRAGILANGDRTLRSGEFSDSYSIRVGAGKWLTVDLRSTAFDPYLILRPPTGSPSENDDAEPGDRQHAQIVFRADEAGQFEIIATSYQPGESGAYTLVYEITDSEPGLRASVPSAIVPADDMMMADTTAWVTPARDQDVSTWTVGLRSFGPIQYGMSLAAAEAAGGVDLRYEDQNEGCGVATIVGGPTNVVFDVSVDDSDMYRIKAVNIRGSDSRSTFRTSSGIGIGSTFAQVRQAYPGRIRTSPDTYGGPSRLLYVPRDQGDRGFAMMFHTETGRAVTGISAGYDYAVTASEGCF